MIFHLLVNLADCLSLFGKTEQVDCKYLLVGKVRPGVVALPPGNSRNAASVLPNNEQVDPDERISSVNVAKGGLHEKMLDASPFKSPRRRGFSTPDWHLIQDLFDSEHRLRRRDPASGCGTTAKGFSDAWLMFFP
jgi:hypothetical protein